jgi:hypothetical protein
VKKTKNVGPLGGGGTGPVGGDGGTGPVGGGGASKAIFKKIAMQLKELSKNFDALAKTHIGGAPVARGPAKKKK